MCWCTPEIRAPYCSSQECKDYFEGKKNPLRKYIDLAYKAQKDFNAINVRPARYFVMDANTYMTLNIEFTKKKDEEFKYNSEDVMETVLGFPIVVCDHLPENSFFLVGEPMQESIKIMMKKLNAKGGQNGSNAT